MAQTLLAMLALVLASLVSFNQQRNSVSNYQRMVENEIEVASAGTIMHILEFVGSRSFDDHSTPDVMQSRNYLPEFEDDFIDVAQFGATDRGTNGCDLIKPYLTPDCNDVDDVDGLQGLAVNAQLSSGQSLPFTVDLEVYYVADGDADQPSRESTLHKLVTVTAYSDYLPSGQVSIQRVISYDPIKAEMDYEEVHGALEGGGIPWGSGGQTGGDPCQGEFC